MALLSTKDDHLLLPPSSCCRSNSASIAQKASWAAGPPTRPALKANRTDPDLGLYDIDFSSFGSSEPWSDLDNIAALGLALDAEGDDGPVDVMEFPPFSLLCDDKGSQKGSQDGTQSSRVVKPFHKWIRTLQKRAQRPKSLVAGGRHDDELAHEPSFQTLSGLESRSNIRHKKSSSDDSFGYVMGMKSASVSLASASIMGRSRRTTARSSYHGRTDRSSRASMSGARCSEDSTCMDRVLSVDPAVTERLLQRRRILEELISTEESYIGDVKFLMNVYVTILASLPTQHMGLRSSINRNLTEIVELHEEILGELHQAVPDSEYSQIEQLRPMPAATGRTGHLRLRSLDSVPEESRARTWLQAIPSMTADPNVAAQVAQVFGKRMKRFFVYEEYGAKYEMMIKDVASAHRTLPQWETYQKGLEALAASLGSAQQHVDRSRKSLTIGDLLVKPIQRICKYPLLFAELLKHTPVCDCPNSHVEIEKVLVRIREATAEINRATDDPSVKATMERTWLLQDRLVFPEQMDASLRPMVRALGQVRLCGALHVCWQTRDGVDGHYMIALLYKDCLCLATGRTEQQYVIQACIGLDTIKIEDVDNGRGLQCHTAPFSWKLVFEVDCQLYETIMTACSPKEEMEWRTRLARSLPVEVHDGMEAPFCSALSLNIKSLGTVFGKPGTVARRLSIHRATTVGPKSSLCQVILKNTTTMRDATSHTTAPPINRSQSVLTTSTRIPVLAPPRGDRARLEAMLADVWSRKILPFPGITTRSRSEHLVRSSASTMMRKLSVASITSSFTKRSLSATSVPKACDEEYAHVSSFVQDLAGLNCAFTRPASAVEDGLDGEAPRLPAISDETERGSSPKLRCATMDAASSGTVRKMDVSHIDGQWQQDDNQPVGRPALRTSSANSVRLSIGPKSASVKSASACSSEKENMGGYQQRSGTKQQVLEVCGNAKPSKWSKVSAINRGLMTGGLRSFFR